MLQIITFQNICTGIIVIGSVVPTYSDNGAPPRLPNGWYAIHLSMPNGSIRNGITVPEKNETTADRMTHISHTTFRILSVTQKNKNSKAKPNDAHNIKDGMTQSVLGIICIPSSDAIIAIGSENINNVGIHSPTVRDMT